MKVSSNRYYEIDSLRAIALCLLIIYHSFASYQPFAEWVKFLQYDQLLEKYWFLGKLLNIWRIPVLFLISGLSIGFLLRRRTVKQLVGDRLLRLVPPLVFCAFFISPIFPALFAIKNGEPFVYHPRPLHLWFVSNLVVYTFLLLPLIIFIKLRPDNLLISGLRLVFPWGLPVILIAPLIWETVASGIDNFAFFVIRFWFGFICFAIGFLFISTGDKFWTSIRTVCHAALPLALLLYLGRVGLLDWHLVEPNAWSTPVECGLWMIAFLGYGSIFLNRPSKIFNYLNQAVFPVYIIHMAVQQTVAFVIFDWRLWPELTFFLHVVFTFGICFLIYEFVIRRVRFLYPVMGLKLCWQKPDNVLTQNAHGNCAVLLRLGRMLTFCVLTPIALLFSLPLKLPAFDHQEGDEEKMRRLPMNPDPIEMSAEP